MALVGVCSNLFTQLMGKTLSGSGKDAFRQSWRRWKAGEVLQKLS